MHTKFNIEKIVYVLKDCNKGKEDAQSQDYLQHNPKESNAVNLIFSYFGGRVV